MCWMCTERDIWRLPYANGSYKNSKVIPLIALNEAIEMCAFVWVCMCVSACNRFGDILLYSDRIIGGLCLKNRCAFGVNTCKPSSDIHIQTIGTISHTNFFCFFLSSDLYFCSFHEIHRILSIEINCKTQKHDRIWSGKYVRRVRAWVWWFRFGGNYFCGYCCYYFDMNFQYIHCVTILFVFLVELSLLQLQEAYARGELKPGLNIEVGDGVRRKAVNNIVSNDQLIVRSFSFVGSFYVYINMVVVFSVFISWAFNKN